MTRYVALLRGINVGGNNTIKMSQLRQHFEAAGFVDVKTYINSGNIIFSADPADNLALVPSIEKLIQDKFGLNIPVVVRSQAQIAATVAAIPADWANDQRQRTDVLFLWAEFDRPAVLEAIKSNPEVDDLIYTPGAVIWHYDRINYRRSKMHSFIGTAIYKKMTARNTNTVRKLRSLMG